MWDNILANRTKIRSLGGRSAVSACIKNTHRLRTVGDFENLAAEMTAPGHVSSSECVCDCCTYLRLDIGCENPNRCYARAAEFLNTLPPKWDPRREHPCDYEAEMMLAVKDIFEGVDTHLEYFDRSITTDGNVGEAFRIFTGTEPSSGVRLNLSICENCVIQVAATDGSCVNNGERDARAGAGVYFGDNSH